MEYLATFEDGNELHFSWWEDEDDPDTEIIVFDIEADWDSGDESVGLLPGWIPHTIHAQKVDGTAYDVNDMPTDMHNILCEIIDDNLSVWLS